MASIFAAIAALAVLAPAANAETITFTQGTDIAIPAGGKASPYPSLLTASGGDGDITDVDVKLTLSQTFPNDLDIALVSPSGDAEILMSDACGEGAALVSQTFTFSSEAGTSLSETGPCATGTFKPTNFGGGDTWESPGPIVSTAQLANFNGEPPNGLWRLFIVDDFGVGGGSGTVASWSVTIKTETAEVIVPGTGTSGVAKPYPSTKTINTPAGTVLTDVNFETPALSHTFPDDLELLLVGPYGQSTLLMSDVCGSTPFINLKRIFDDEATASQTDNGSPACSGTSVKPTDVLDNTPAPDTWPTPAPGGPYGKTLSVFDGLEGGAWKLFALDDENADSGYLSSWTLKVTTRNAADTGFSGKKAKAKAKEGKKAVLVVTRSGPSSLGPATLTVSTQAGSAKAADFTAPASTLEFAAGQASRTIAIPIRKDKAGEAKESFKVVLSSPKNDARLTGTNTARVDILPANKVKFGKLKKDAEEGTAKLVVKVPAPGKLTLGGKDVKRVKKNVKKAGKVVLPIEPKGNALQILQQNGKVIVQAKVAFKPKGGQRFSKTKALALAFTG